MKPLLAAIERPLPNGAESGWHYHPAARAFDAADLRNRAIADGSSLNAGQELHFGPRTLIFFEGDDAESVFRARSRPCRGSWASSDAAAWSAWTKLDEIYVHDVCQLCRLTGTQLPRAEWCSAHAAERGRGRARHRLRRAVGRVSAALRGSQRP